MATTFPKNLKKKDIFLTPSTLLQVDDTQHHHFSQFRNSLKCFVTFYEKLAYLRKKNLICCLHYFQFMPHWIKKHSEIEISILKMYLYHQMHKESRKIFQHHILYFLKVQTKYFHIFTYTIACKKWNKENTKLKLLLFVCSYIF